MKKIAVFISIFLCTSMLAQAQLVDTYTNPEEAYLEAQKTLELVSSTLNDGLQPLKQASSDISMVNQIVNESFDNLIK